MIKKFSKHVAGTVLAVTLGMGGMSGAHATINSELSPEIGQFGPGWWAHTTPTQTSATVTAASSAVETPEIGHLGWAWWSGVSTNAVSLSHSSPEFSNELTPELGHVAWQWWN